MAEVLRPIVAEVLNSTLDERKENNREATIVISKATRAKSEKLLTKAQFLITTAPSLPVLRVEGSQAFDWEGQDEKNKTEEARIHLMSLLTSGGVDFTNDFQLVNTSRVAVLSFEDNNIGKISGGTDLIITAKGVAPPSYSKGICVLFELKTSDKMNELGLAECAPQALVEFVAANFVSYQASILAVLTDLGSNSTAWKSTCDPVTGKVVNQEYPNLSLDQVISLVASHLETDVVKDPTFVPSSTPNAPQAQRALQMKRKLDDTDLNEALDQFEEMAEGTENWSRDRALATWHFLQKMGVEEMPTVVKYSMMYT
jgi:hypothetical protein